MFTEDFAADNPEFDPAKVYVGQVVGKQTQEVQVRAGIIHKKVQGSTVLFVYKIRFLPLDHFFESTTHG